MWYVALACLASVFLAQAVPGSLKELRGNPDRFYAQAVSVTGAITNVREGGWRRPYYTFDLDDGTSSVHVIAFGTPSCRSGTATVEGTFGQIKWPMRDSYDEIMAQSVICLSHTRDPSGPTEK